MKKIILGLAIIGLNGDCFCMDSTWDTEKSSTDSIAPKVTQKVQKINRKARVALGISALVGGGILAYHSLPLIKPYIKPLNINTGRSYTHTYVQYQWLPWGKPIRELYSVKPNPSILEKMMIRWGRMKNPVAEIKVNAWRKFWIDTKVTLGVLTYTSPFLVAFFIPAGAFVHFIGQ